MTTALIPRTAALLATLATLTGLVLPAASSPLPRANIVLANTIAVDPDAGTVTLPLHRGTAGGKTVWYIITDSSDRADAQRRGALFAPLLARAGSLCDACVQRAVERDGAIAFPGAPDFAPVRGYTPGSAGFPPTAAHPGATADSHYTPFVKLGDVVINAPIVATGDGPFDVTGHTNTQDRVVAIDPARKTVTLALAKGFALGKRVLYISTEASDPGAATIERATYVPSLKPKAGWVSIEVVTNGTHQGLAWLGLTGHLNEDASAANVASLASSMNVLSTLPTGNTKIAYSPLWNVDFVSWKPAVLAAHGDTVLTSEAQVAQHQSDLTAIDGGQIGPAGVFVNCPVVAYVDLP
jgi:hypothetical protein